MRDLALNIVLAIVWLFLTGHTDFANLVAGLVAGWIVIAIIQGPAGSYPATWRAAFHLFFLFSGRLIAANLQLARDVIRPHPPFFPAIFAYQTEGLHDAEVALLSIITSLTPGTVVVDFDFTARELHIHSLYAENTEGVRNQLREYENLIRRLRPQRREV